MVTSKTKEMIHYQVNTNPNTPKSPFSSLINLLVVVGAIALVILLINGFFKLIYWLAPGLLVAALIIDYRVGVEYFRNLLDTFRRDVLAGVLRVLFAVFCYPLLFLWLLLKAIFYKKIEKISQQINEQTDAQQAHFQQRFGGNLGQRTQTNEKDFAEYEEVEP